MVSSFVKKSWLICQKTKKSSNNIQTVGLLVPDIRSGYAPILARGAEDEAIKNDISLILCNTDDTLGKQVTT